jgi:hypothetical protein
MSTNLSLNAEQYNDFLRCLTNLKEECNDIDIKGGIIRERSNDKTSIFQVDLNPILTDVNMSISDIKKKLDLLKIFAGQEVNLEINNEKNGYFILSDQHSSLKFMSPAYQFIDNKFMTEEELTAIFNLDEENLILEHSLDTMMTERIRIITQSFNIKAIQVDFDGEEAVIKAGTQAKDQFAKFVEGITTNVVLDKCSANLGTIPFGIDHDEDVEFKMYKDPTQDISLNTFTTDVGECELVIFTRSSLIQDEEE